MDDRHRKEAGIAGETAALNYLRDQGLKLVARNYRCKAGEIDLIMLDGPTLALIEVRYRTDDAFGGAAASVTRRKQRRLIIAARHLVLTRADLRRYPARFDVVAVSPGPHGLGHALHRDLRHELHIEWIKAAFTT